MGLDVGRVHGEVDEELLCPICSGVLQDPIAAPQCEHAFCLDCITQWLERQPTCPVDRQTVQVQQLKPVPRILRNLLARLEVTCDNSHFGCGAVVKLDLLGHHLKECEHNPKRPVSCQQGCGLMVPKDEMEEHNCVRELRSLARTQEQKLSEMQHDIGDCKYQLAEQRREISILKDLMRTSRPLALAASSTAAASSSPASSVAAVTGSSSSTSTITTANGASNGVPAATSSSSRTVTNQIQDDEVARWTAGLARARVTRWGGMISTPDAVLQTMIQRALGESRCPDHIINELMSNAHERRWPPGLLTLETRQMNRRQYEQYVCRRIPNKQAVVVMACDNTHMSDDMILEPGLVMIFAHGIE